MDAEERNLKVQTFINDKLSTSTTSSSHSISNDFKAMISNIINCPALGFRGIVLTSLAGKHVDKNYDPTKDFYACNPRSIFEKGIRLALMEKKIPCGKSDPLNVAKAIQQINKEWAKGKRPSAVAHDVAVLLEFMFNPSTPNKAYNNLQDHFFAELATQKREERELNLGSRKGTNSIHTAKLLIEFMTDFPDGGATPQFFCGEVLHLTFDDEPNLKVGGLDGDVNATNTTSKKPGDIWVEDVNDQLQKIYEITLKVVDANRLEDCVQNLEALNIDTSLEVVFLCRIPEDTSGLKLDSNSVMIRNYLFQFLDIRKWFYYSFTTLTKEKQQAFLKDTQAFMNELKRKQVVRDAWELLVSSI
jgi:hypothetical protein